MLHSAATIIIELALKSYCGIADQLKHIIVHVYGGKPFSISTTSLLYNMTFDLSVPGCLPA